MTVIYYSSNKININMLFMTVLKHLDCVNIKKKSIYAFKSKIIGISSFTPSVIPLCHNLKNMGNKIKTLAKIIIIIIIAYRDHSNKKQAPDATTFLNFQFVILFSCQKVNVIFEDG